jgi:hypothetical protein
MTQRQEKRFLIDITVLKKPIKHRQVIGLATYPVIGLKSVVVRI